ncbi:AP-3 complex subunit mu-2 [Blattella germanica]|nr:AP-3 complex subunit mu-2 [Blattella germanica]
MIHSLFIINSSGDVFMEKHWKSVVSRSVCDYFFDQQRKVGSPEDMPPVIATPHHYLISIHRCCMFFVAVCMTEVNARSQSSKSTMLSFMSVSATLPSGQLSNVPWRRTGVKYTNNEAYFDVVEEVDAIIDKAGSTVFAEIQGYIDCCIKLSGMPDLTLSFMNPRLFDDVSFHPCVRFKRWESERILSFIPPDGNFRLMSYHIGSQNIVAIPIYVRHNISFREAGGGRLDITVGPKQTIGRTISLQSGAAAVESNPAINVQFIISQLAVSGLKVNRLDMYCEKYKPFKGVKYITKAGRFQIRM